MPRSPSFPCPRPAWRPGWRTLPLLAMTLALLGSALLPGCSPVPPALRLQVQEGDREREWGLLYYASWRKERNSTYLLLSRERTQQAILLYLDVQRRMGYAYPDFYLVDHRRAASCRFLTQLQREADGYDIRMDRQPRAGCFD